MITFKVNTNDGRIPIMRDNEYCTCINPSSITTGFEDGFGYWDVCCDCGKRLEDGCHYYNHYDGEVHDDIDMW